MIEELERIINDLKEYKEKLDRAEIKYRNVVAYLAEKDLEEDFYQWQLDCLSLSGKPYLEKIDKMKEASKKDFNKNILINETE